MHRYCPKKELRHCNLLCSNFTKIFCSRLRNSEICYNFSELLTLHKTLDALSISYQRSWL